MVVEHRTPRPDIESLNPSLISQFTLSQLLATTVKRQSSDRYLNQMGALTWHM
jgi:hypothetical protein